MAVPTFEEIYDKPYVPTFEELYEEPRRKSVIQAFEDGWERAGTGMAKQLAGLAEIEAEIGGAVREKFWNFVSDGKPEYLENLDANLLEWGQTMSAAADQWYAENPETAYAISPDAGFWQTTKEVIGHPENLVQGITEAIPMLAEAALGHYAAVGIAGRTVPWLLRAGRITGMATPIVGEVYSNARKEGTPPSEALPQAFLTGFGEGAIEEWTLGKKIGIFKGAGQAIQKSLGKLSKDILWGGLKAYARGTAEEASQELNRNFWRYVFTDRSQQLLQGVAQAGAMGGPLETAMAGAFGIAGGARARLITRPEMHLRADKLRNAINENENISDKQKGEINKEIDKTHKDIDAGEFDRPVKPRKAVEPTEVVAEAIPQEVQDAFNQFMQKQDIADAARSGDSPTYSALQGAATRAKNQFHKLVDEKMELTEEAAEKLGDEMVKKALAKPAPEAEITPIQKLIVAAEKAEKLERKITRELRRVERGKRAARGEELLTDPKLTTEEAVRKSRGALKGELPHTEFALDEEMFTVGDFHNLVDNIRFDRTANKLRHFEKQNVIDALNKIFVKGRVPAQYELKLLELAFGEEGIKLAKAIGKLRTPKTWEKFVAGANFPRAMLASFDLSAALRQGILLAPSHPQAWANAAFVVGPKAFASKDYARQVEIEIKTNPYYELLLRHGIELTAFGPGSLLMEREEPFMTDISQKVWGMRQSERAYVTTLNKLRADVFYHFCQEWEGQGKTDEDYKTLAQFINNATGRGNLKALKKHAPILNALFFSPRFVASRIGAMADIFTATPEVRKIVLADLGRFVGSGMLALGLLSTIPGVKVEKDPRSSDFGKVRIGNMRLDFWAGYQPLVRYISQFIGSYPFTKAQRKTTGTKEIIDVNRFTEVIWPFIRSKLSPLASLSTDLITGKTFIGETFEKTPTGVLKQLWNRTAPLWIQDAVEAFKYQGLAGGLIASPAAFWGFGVQTWPPTEWTKVALTKDKYAQEVFGKKWSEVSDLGQELLRTNYPVITKMENHAKVSRTEYPFLSKYKKEQLGIMKKVQKRLPRIVQDELDSLDLNIGLFSRVLSQNWALNDARYERYQELSEKGFKIILPRIILSSDYRRMSEVEKRDALDYAIKLVKQTARREIVNSARFEELKKIE